MENSNEAFKTILERYNDLRTIEVKYNILINYIKAQETKSYFDGERLFELVNIIENGGTKKIEKKIQDNN